MLAKNSELFSKFTQPQLIPPNVKLYSEVIYSLEKIGKENLLYLVSQWKLFMTQNSEDGKKDKETEEKMELLTQMAEQSESKPIFPKFRTESYLTPRQHEILQEAISVGITNMIFDNEKVFAGRLSNEKLHLHSSNLLKKEENEYMMLTDIFHFTIWRIS